MKGYHTQVCDIAEEEDKEELFKTKFKKHVHIDTYVLTN